MKYLLNFSAFLNRDLQRENESKYFTVMLRWSYCFLALYFVIYMIFCMFVQQNNACLLATPWLLLTFYGFYLTYSASVSGDKSFFIYTGILLCWTIFSVIFFGWDCGCQHLMIPLLIMFFFSVSHRMRYKILFMLFLFFLRVYLLFYCSSHEPVFTLTEIPLIIFLVINGLFLFISISIVCIIFSNNIQKSEKQLLLYNRRLQEQASTDPLTGLYNRRYMLDLLERHISSRPSHTFCIALSDIDYFKKINDTLGHNCGDYVLQELALLFTKKMDGKGQVCRWGGEEFFFFFPNKNLDEVNILMNDLNFALSSQLLQFEDHTFHVTMTVGVEEYDFNSPVKEMIRQADEKLYFGKENGRNQVVF